MYYVFHTKKGVVLIFLQLRLPLSPCPESYLCQKLFLPSWMGPYAGTAYQHGHKSHLVRVSLCIAWLQAWLTGHVKATLSLQVIRAEDLPGTPYDAFGYSLSGGMDLDNNGYPDLLTSSFCSDRVLLLRCVSLQLCSQSLIMVLICSKAVALSGHFSYWSVRVFLLLPSVSSLPVFVALHNTYLS